MPRITAASAVQATIAELTKEGNKVAKSGELPPGRNAEKGHDVASFNAGMRYAMQKISTTLKQFEKGTFKMPEAKPAPAKKTASAPAKTTAKKAPAKKASATKKTASAKKAPAAKANGVKKAPRGQTKADRGEPVTPSQREASITPIEEARQAVAADLLGGKKRVTRR